MTMPSMSDTLAAMTASPSNIPDDIGAGGIDLGAQLAVSIGGLSAAVSGLARQYAAQAAQDAAVRFIKPPPMVGTVSGGGTLTLKLVGPELGYQWTVRRVIVADGGPAGTQATAVAGLAGVYAGVVSADAIGQGQAGPLLENLEWLISPLPNAAEFGDGQIVLQAQENLYVLITGGTPGQVIKVATSYELYRPGTGTDVTGL